jgi:hypothetical protein
VCTHKRERRSAAVHVVSMRFNGVGCGERCLAYTK